MFSGNIGTGNIDGSGPIVYGINIGLNAMIGTPIKVSPNTSYTIALDPFATDGGSFSYCDFYFLDAGPLGFASTDGFRRAVASMRMSPPNAAYLVPRVGLYISGAGQSSRGRRVKVNEGAFVAPYSSEASVALSFATINGAFARAALTLDVDNYLTGWEMNNNGQSGDMTIRADRFRLLKPGGGARTEYANGAWKVFDENGVLRVQMGNLSA